LGESIAPITSDAAAESCLLARANFAARKKFLTLLSNFLAMKL